MKAGFCSFSMFLYCKSLVFGMGFSFVSKELTGDLGPVSQVPKLVGRMSGDMILFVSSKRRRFKA